jgi:uncharacterized protein (TIGR03000 family)
VGHTTTAFSSAALAARGVAVRGRFFSGGAFTPIWFGGFPLTWWGAWPWGLGTGWGWTPWPSLNTWLGWGIVQPVYYDFGRTIVFQNNQVYANGRPGPTAEQYYQQASDLAQANLAVEGAENEWKPLGVFALVQGEQTEANSVFQLTINKTGILRGTYYDALTGTTLAVQGAVDRKTLRAAWTVGNNRDTVYDTGLYNLTKDETPVLVHFGKDRTRQWTLVRIKPPEQPRERQAQPQKEELLPQPRGGPARASVAIRVPADAEVWFNGYRTTQTGTERTFTTPLLDKGEDYYYDVRARWTENGKSVVRERRVLVRAGMRAQADFLGSSQ